MMKLENFFHTDMSNGVGFIRLVVCTPDWLRDAVRFALRGETSNWAMEIAERACRAIDMGELSRDNFDASLQAFADGCVDTVRASLFGWASMMCSTLIFQYAEEVATLNGCEGDVAYRLAMIQREAVRSIAGVILAARPVAPKRPGT